MEEKKSKTLSLQKYSNELVSTDPLSHYLKQVSQYPLLEEEEEKSLARRVIDYKDVEAARILVSSHLRLVVKIAMEYRNAYHNVLDLIQEGNVGLLKAVKSFNPDKGARLAYYASWWIRSYILKYILDNFRLIKIGTTQTQRKLFFNLMKEKERIEKMGIGPQNKLLADRLEVSEEEIAEMDQRLAQNELSIDSPLGAGEDAPKQLDFLKDPSLPADEVISNQEFKDVLLEKLKEFSKSLKDREYQIFQERLIADVPKTLQEIADEYHITRERVRQIEERIKEKIKKYFEESEINIEENLKES